MALVLTAPDSVSVGEVIEFSVAGATDSGNLDIEVSSEEAGGVSVKAVMAASSGGAFDSAGALEVTPNSDGHVNVSVTDVTAATTETARIEVFVSE